MHWPSEEQVPQVLLVQMRPSLAPVQSLLVAWQFPGLQLPWKQMSPAPYRGSFVHCPSVPQLPQVWAAEAPHT